ncbi:hypothetical protein PTKIN_Ptkin06aG0078200 [Pterospermum kingtungense]
MDKKSAMRQFQVMVLATLEHAATNVVNPSRKAVEIAFKLFPTVSLVNVLGLAPSHQLNNFAHFSSVFSLRNINSFDF